VVCQGGAEEDEPGALCRLVDRLRRGGGAVPLWLADRNFCTWNVICHMADAGASFCLRAKDSWVDALLRVTVNYKYANSTNPTHHFHQRSFANSANAYPPILAPARASSGTSGSRSFIL
jgi:hypothetical protein